MQEECELALKSKIPACEGWWTFLLSIHALVSLLREILEWTPFQPYMSLAYTISRISSRFLGGTELSRNDEWVYMNIQTTIMTHRAAQEIRRKYSPGWRWLARWRDKEAKSVRENRRRAAEIVAPVLKKRLTSTVTESGDPDAIQWLLALAGTKGKKAAELATEQLFLGVTSIHSTTASILSTIYDLMDHPDAMEEIISEIQGVQAQLSGGRWTKSALLELEKLDSFMKESQRVHTLGCSKPPPFSPPLTRVRGELTHQTDTTLRRE
jgi:ent-kaurene oxidase